MTDAESVAPPANGLEAAAAALRAGDAATAEGHCRAVLETTPDRAEAHSLLGVVEMERDRHAAAEQRFRRALASDPDEPRYWVNLGSALGRQGRLPEARDALERALDLDPAHPSALFNIGNVLRDLGLEAEAEAAYRRCIDGAPPPVRRDALNSLGVLHQAAGRPDQSVACFEAVLAERPDNAPALWNLCNALEQSNRVPEAAAAAGRLLAITPQEPLARLLKARLENRLGQPAVAAERLRHLLADSPRRHVRTEALFELGAALDRLGRVDEAMESFRNANIQWSRLNSLDGRRYLARVGRNRRWLTPRRLQGFRPSPGVAGERPPPLFFVGFPRSGTTLVERMLAAHPDVATTAERSPLRLLKADLVSRHGGRDAPYPRFLETLTADEKRACRVAFWHHADALFGTAADGPRLVDKLPLNIVEIGLIAAIFPEAPVLMALRDPRDACLSGFMQAFAANEAMANFTSLAGAVALYDAVMGLWLAVRDALPNPWLEYRYEDLIADVPANTRRILEFLGLSWDAAVLTDRRTPRGELIRTPSYRQVSEGISNRAVGRWKPYRWHLAPILPVLAPYVGAFGYAP